jgi:trans-2,3-dihydro-3-hydroxyanthranilate isomerase
MFVFRVLEISAMPTYPLTLLDVFAVRPLEGNLLAVIHDADGVSTETMQTQARRFNLSETSYIQTATDPGSTYRHRIFTVTEELPFAGHPSLGTAVARAYRAGESTAHYVQQTGAGLQELWVERDGPHAIAKLRQNPVVFGDEIEPALILRALGLQASDAHGSLPAQVASTGLATTVVPLSDPEALTRISVDWPEFRAALGEDPADPIAHNCYVVAEVAPGHWKARMFAADIPGGEDAATGSAAGPFGAYLHARLGLESVSIDQGVEMGCPSRLEVDLTDGIVLSGSVWITGSGEIELPGEEPVVFGRP